ncbi:MAG: hypothetical protein M9924_06130 [Rhizobiaceae bacterium]|nr:hypothetical protein [Rhizobiaceae bacterium]
MQWMQLAIVPKKLHLGGMRKVLVCFGAMAGILVGVSLAGSGEPPGRTALAEAPACKLVESHELENYIGVPMFVKASSGTDTSTAFCSWGGGTEGVTVEVMLFPAESHGIAEGDERARFDLMIEAQKHKFQPGEFVPVPELADDAWALDLSDNPAQYIVVYLFKGGDNATITTREIGLEATVEIARQVAERMP